MPALKDMISDSKSLHSSFKKNEKPQSITYEKIKLPNKKSAIHSVEHNIGSKKELQELLDQDFEGTIKAIKINQKKALKAALEQTDFSDLISNIEHTPSHSNNKIISFTKKFDGMLKDALKEIDFQEFNNSVNLSKKELEEKIYPGVVSNVDKDGITVLLGNIFGTSFDRTISYDKMPGFLQKKQFHKGDQVFVDLKKDPDKTKLVVGSNFNKQRKEELNDIGVDINGYKPIFYMTRSGKIVKGKVIGFGEDITGKQVLFQTRDGKKFPLSVENLKKGINFAKEAYKKEKRKETTDFKKPDSLKIGESISKNQKVA